MIGDKEFIDNMQLNLLIELGVSIAIMGGIMADAAILTAVLMWLFLAVTRIAYYRKKIKRHYGPRGYPAWWRDFKF